MRAAVRDVESAERNRFDPPFPFRFSGESPSGIRPRPRLTLEVAAALATHVDAARVRAATEGRTLIYTIRWI